MRVTVTKHEVSEVENKLCDTYTTNRHGDLISFVHLFKDLGLHEEIPLEFIAEDSISALSWILSYVIESDKETLRGIYADCFIHELSENEYATSEFTQAMNLAKSYSQFQDPIKKSSMKTLQKKIKDLESCLSSNFEAYREEYKNLEVIINSGWFRRNSYTMTANGINNTYYDRSTDRYYYLQKELRRIYEIQKLSQIISPLLDEDFDPFEANPSREGVHIHTKLTLKNNLLSYLKGMRTEYVEILVKEKEVKRFQYEQMLYKIDYLTKYNLLKTGLIGDKLYVKKTARSLNIYVVPEKFDGKLSGDGVVQVFGKNKYGTFMWFYKGDWINVVESHVDKLNSESVKDEIVQSKSRTENKISSSKKTLNVLNTF